MATSVNIRPGFGIATFHWEHALAASGISCTIGFKNTTDEPDPLVVATALNALITATAAPCAPAGMITGWTYAKTSVFYQDLDIVGFFRAGEVNPNIAGTASVTGGAQPPYSPLVIKKVTSGAGREFRGRMYPPLTITSQLDVAFDGSISTAPLASTRARWAAFLGPMKTGNYPPFLLHSTDPALPPDPITDLVVRPIVATQRRRKRTA